MVIDTLHCDPRIVFGISVLDDSLLTKTIVTVSYTFTDASHLSKVIVELAIRNHLISTARRVILFELYCTLNIVVVSFLP